jgi:hypothetical protein
VCLQLGASRRRCLGSRRCGIFQKQWPCPKFRTKAVRSQSRKRNRHPDTRGCSSATNTPPSRPS